MKRVNQIVLILISIVAISSIIYKAIVVPITHDEVSTVMHYYNFSVWEIMMYPDNWPNNHILNTLLAKFFINIFGKEVWIIRIPSFLSFFIYLYAVYRLLNLFFKKDSLLIIAAFSLFISNVYMIEFFGLCRGYAMASALVTLSASYVITAFIYNKEKHLWIAFTLSILASYANFTVLVFWVAIGLIFALFILLNYKNDLKLLLKKISLLALYSFAYLALIITPIIKMTSTEQFKYWSSNGFYKDTVLSMIKTWKYGDHLYSKIDNNYFGVLIVFLFLLSFVLIIKRYLQNRSFQVLIRNKNTIAFLILSTTIIVNLIQTFVLKTPNLNGRIAIFLYPLFIISIIGLLSNLEKLNKLKYLFAILIPIFSFYHIGNSFQSKSVYEWWYDANNLEVIEYLQKKVPEGQIDLQTHWYFYNSFYYYKNTNKASRINLYQSDKKVDRNSSAKYYYVVDSEINNLEPQYKKIKRFGWDRWLMIKVK